MSKTITVFGGANMDILGMPGSALRLRDSNIGRVLLRPGGVGRNVACHIAALGEACVLMTAFGQDDLSEPLKASCVSAGVDISAARTVPDARTGVYLCLHDETGDMLAAVNDMAVADALTPDYAASCLPRINSSALCVVDANPPAETVEYLARNAAVPLLMDPVSCAKLDRVLPVLSCLDAIKPNIHEAMALTGCRTARECAQALLRQGVKRAFISLGAEGLCCADDQGITLLPVEHPSEAAKTGAGDALCAGLAVAMAHGEPTLECAKFGMAHAARYLQSEEETP